MEKEKVSCPKCGNSKNQARKGFTVAKSQRWFCNECKCKYTPNPKKWIFSDEERRLALRLLALGNTGRGIGKAMEMSKANAYRWAKEYAKKGL